MNPYTAENSTANVYKNMEVSSTNRIKLVVMVYDAAIASLKQAIESHNRNDLTKRNQFISRTQFIIHELNNALDHQRGKEIASTLQKLYHFLTRHMGSVLTDNDIQKVEQSLKILFDLREAWHEISLKTVERESTLHGAAVYHGGKQINCV